MTIATFPITIRTDIADEREVEVTIDRLLACQSEHESPHDGLLDCDRLRGHTGMHVAANWDHTGMHATEDLWVWR